MKHTQFFTITALLNLILFYEAQGRGQKFVFVFMAMLSAVFALMCLLREKSK